MCHGFVAAYTIRLGLPFPAACPYTRLLVGWRCRSDYGSRSLPVSPSTRGLMRANFSADALCRKAACSSKQFGRSTQCPARGKRMTAVMRLGTGTEYNARCLLSFPVATRGAVLNPARSYSTTEPGALSSGCRAACFRRGFGVSNARSEGEPRKRRACLPHNGCTRDATG